MQRRNISALKARARWLAALPRRIAVHYRHERRRSEGPPVFIIGCPRSGTTLVRQILDSHSRIACPGETWFLTGMLEQLRNEFFVEGLRRLGATRGDVVASTRAMALHYFETYLYRAGKARWADKTPGHTQYCPELLEVLGPDVRFIYLLRHGLDVVNSMQMQRWMELVAPGATDPLEKLLGAARYWIEVTSAFANFQAAHPAICHTVRFEDLTTSPERVMRGVLGFVGEPWEPRILDYHAFPHSGNGDYKTARQGQIAPNSHNYRSWPIEHQQQVGGLLAHHLVAHGYHPAP